MPRSTADILNESNPNKLASGAQVAKLGQCLESLPQFRRAATVTNVLVLPETARASVLLAAFSTAGSSTGAKAIALNAAPTAGQASITPTGSISFVAGEATTAEVVYVAETGPIIEEVVPVATNVGTLLAGRAARILLSAVGLTGTTPGVKTVDYRAAAAGAGEAALNAAGTGVVFNAGEAITSARIRYIATPGIGATPADPVADLSVADKAF